MVLLAGMPSKAITVKIPRRIIEQMPTPGNGRSLFIVKAIEEKLARRRSNWKPRSDRGRRMAALLAKGQKERTPLLSDEQIEQELKERRGRMI